MSSPGQAAIARAQRMLGREFEVVNYEYDQSGGAGPYADGGFVETADSPHVVPATIQFPGTEPDSAREVSGADVERDATIYLQHDLVPLEDGTDDETRATEIRDLEADTEYRVVAVDHHLNLLGVHVEEI